MKRITIGALVTLSIWLAAAAQAAPRFEAVDVYIDAAQPVAAWQFELGGTGGRMTVVGVENGDSAAFGDAPYYDRTAVDGGRADRIVVAAFSLAPPSELPSGRVRIATVHVMTDGGDVDYPVRLIIATTHDGQPIDASISLTKKGVKHERI